MEGWNRDEAQQRAAWSRSGASEWEVGGAPQPSADDDDYLKAARRAQSKRMETLAIPVPDEDFDSLNFEVPGEQEDLSEGTIPLPTPSGGGESGGVGTSDDVKVAAAETPVVPQWYPPREPVGYNGEDRREPETRYSRRSDRPTMHDTTRHATDGVHCGDGRQIHSSRQPVANQTLDFRRQEAEQMAPEPGPDLVRVRSPPSFAE